MTKSAPNKTLKQCWNPKIEHMQCSMQLCLFSQRFLPLFSQYAKTNPEECISLPVDFKPKLWNKYDIKYSQLCYCSKVKYKKRADVTPGIELNKEQLDKLTANA